MHDFWDEVVKNAGEVGDADSPDFDFSTMDGRTAADACRLPVPKESALRELTDAARAANAIDPAQDAGTRVRFVSNLGAVLTYDDPPADGLEGTVVTVKTGGGVTTHLDNRLFVLFDDGKFRGIQAEHLRLAGTSKRASNVRMVVSDLGDLSSFFVQAASGADDELVHRATKDLWALKQDGDNFVIERLFDETGNPLKV